VPGAVHHVQTHLNIDRHEVPEPKGSSREYKRSPRPRGLHAPSCFLDRHTQIPGLRGGLPLLAPMSEVAGRMSVQVAAHNLEKEQGGAGILLGGVPGIKAAKVVILGGGVAGTNAARVAMSFEASVTVIDKALSRLYELDLQFGSQLQTLFSTVDTIEQEVVAADAVIGAVLAAGAAAPKLVSREMVKRMRPGSVIVDISIDQGGCFETSRATTHDHPTYVEEGVIHYCVTNMPGAVARTSTFALKTCDTAYFGGIDNSMCTWSGMRCPSSTFDSLCSASLRNTSPRCRRSSRYNALRRHFGMKTT
jgi:alanine dehydrogenase